MKHILFSVVLFFSLQSLSGQDFHGTIVGGVDAQEGEFPSLVSLRSTSRSHFCGGTLIKRNWVLTAAHCVNDDYTKSLVVGLVNQKQSEKGEMFTPEQVITHPNYDANSSDYDFALVRISGNASFRPTALNKTEIEPNTMSTVVGWGYLRENGYKVSDQLQKVDVPVVSKADCDAAYPSRISDRMLCAGLKAGGKDSCQGDSGGPLFTMNENKELVISGVVSWGRGCARADAYGVYSKVSTVVDWIEEMTK